MATRSPTAQELSHSVAFDRRDDIDDGYGNTKGEWVEQFAVRAAFRHRGGSEAVSAARLEGRNQLAVYVRASGRTQGIISEWRMRDLRTGTAYDIKIVDAVTDRRWVYLEVTAGSAT